MHFAIKSELLRNGLFHPSGENNRHERASGVERGKKRAEEVEDNHPMKPAGCGENGGASLRAGRRGTGKCRGVLEGENKGAAGRPRQPGTGKAEQGSEEEGRDSLSPASHALHFSPATFFSH